MFAITFPARAGIFYVKADATGTSNGTSWANAFTDLQAALASAKTGDEIWVASGTYKPTNGTDRRISFVLVNGVALYGGFVGNESKHEDRDWSSQKTILSGDIGTESIKDNSFHVVIGAKYSIIEGFILADGNADYPNAGGGLFNNDIKSRMSVKNCLFINNYAEYGGGIYNGQTTLTLTNCIFSSNTASNGGGIYYSGGNYTNDSSSMTAINCTFRWNTAHSGGGTYNTGLKSNLTFSHCNFISNYGGYNGSSGSGSGMFNDNCSPVLSNCLFSSNTSTGIGGAMTNYTNAGPTVIDTLFIYNKSAKGGGIYNYSINNNPTFIGCNFVNNQAGGDGGGMYNLRTTPLTVIKCNFINNAAGLNSNIGHGGGMSNTDCSPIVIGCSFCTNNADNGGGIFSENSSLTVTQCMFRENSARVGGGMVNGASGRPTVTKCVFIGNTAEYAGGIENNGGSPTISNCIFHHNKAIGYLGHGGGIANVAGLPSVTNCTLIENVVSLSSRGYGGGIFIRSCSPTIKNCILWGNYASDGPEIYKGSTNPLIRNCDIFGSGGSGIDWNPSLGIDAGGNIMAEPGFFESSNPAGIDLIWMTKDDGVRLQKNSPCINNGDPMWAPTDDIIGNMRTGLPEIGAYEYFYLNSVDEWSLYR